MKRRPAWTSSLWKARRREGVAKKPKLIHRDWYEREYRQGRDPYRAALRRHNFAALDRRFRGYLAGVKDPELTPSWADLIMPHPDAVPSLRCPARVR